MSRLKLVKRPSAEPASPKGPAALIYVSFGRSKPSPQCTSRLHLRTLGTHSWCFIFIILDKNSTRLFVFDVFIFFPCHHLTCVENLILKTLLLFTIVYHFTLVNDLGGIREVVLKCFKISCYFSVATKPKI